MADYLMCNLMYRRAQIDRGMSRGGRNARFALRVNAPESRVFYQEPGAGASAIPDSRFGEPGRSGAAVQLIPGRDNLKK